jgi:hypothetical protein
VRLLDLQAPWLQDLSVSESGTVVGAGGRFGLGAVLVVERRQTRALLLARKSYRAGYAGNHQWALPGGMVRPHVEGGGMSGWIHTSLATRVAAEVRLDLSTQGQYRPLDAWPPWWQPIRREAAEDIRLFCRSPSRWPRSSTPGPTTPPCTTQAGMCPSIYGMRSRQRIGSLLPTKCLDTIIFIYSGVEHDAFSANAILPTGQYLRQKC